MNNSRKLDWNIFLVLAISIALRVPPYLNHIQQFFRADDFGTLGYPAYLAGYDWTNFYAGEKHYYGFGYYWIFAPLFKIVSSPEQLLLLMAMINSVLIVLTSLLIYHVAVRYLKMPRTWITVALSVVLTCFQGDCHPRGRYWVRTDNEIPLFFVCWLFVWVLLAAYHETNKIKRMILSCLGALILVWGLTVHERTLALILAFVFVLVLVWLIRREWVLHPAAFLIVLGVGFVLQRMLRSHVIHTMWQGGWPQKNTDAFSSASIWFLESVDSVRSFCLVLFGNLHTLIGRGFGIPAISIVICFYWIFQNICARKKNSTFAGSQATADVSAKTTDRTTDKSAYKTTDKTTDKITDKIADAVSEKTTDAAMLVTLIFGVCIAATILGMAVNWGHAIYPFIQTDTVGRAFKGICYSRYTFVFIGPVLLGTLTYCYHKMKDFNSSCIVVSWAVFGFIELVFYSIVYPYCVVGDMLYPGNFKNRALGTYGFDILTVEGRSIISNGLMVVIMVLITYALSYRIRTEIREIRSAQSGNLAAEYAGPSAATMEQGVKSGRKLLCIAITLLFLLFVADRFSQSSFVKPSLELVNGAAAVEEVKQLQSEDALPENIYLNVSYAAYTLQFTFWDIPFRTLPPTPEQAGESNLIIWDRRNTEFLMPGYSEFVDQEGYWYYTNDEAAIRSMEDDADMRNGADVPVLDTQDDEVNDELANE